MSAMSSRVGASRRYFSNTNGEIHVVNNNTPLVAVYRSLRWSSLPNTKTTRSGEWRWSRWAKRSWHHPAGSGSQDTCVNILSPQPQARVAVAYVVFTPTPVNGGAVVGTICFVMLTCLLVLRGGTVQRGTEAHVQQSGTDGCSRNWRHF